MKVIYNPKCSKCRELGQFLEDQNISFDKILYLETGISVALVQEIVDKINVPVLEMIRTNEEEYSELFKGKTLSTPEWVEALSKNPKLLQRPIIITGNRAIIARSKPLEDLLPLLKDGED